MPRFDDQPHVARQHLAVWPKSTAELSFQPAGSSDLNQRIGAEIAKDFAAKQLALASLLRLFHASQTDKLL